MDKPENRLTLQEVSKLVAAQAAIERGEYQEAKQHIDDVIVSAAPNGTLWNGRAYTRADRGFQD